MQRTASQSTTIHRTVERADRGPRPKARGWIHFGATIASVIAGTVLTTYGWMRLSAVHAAGITIYAVGLVQLFAVSAAYHLGRWRRGSTVQWWRRADHATIAVFIAATYTPLCLLVLRGPTALCILTIAWLGALVGVLLNLVWINHPRWLDVTVYLVLGWLIVIMLPELRRSAGPTVVWLLFAGGLAYTLGAIGYGLRWPGRNATTFGYHEYFHATTIVAATIHMVALWLVAST